MSEKINIEGNEISIKLVNDQDYISLTDIAKKREEKEPIRVIRSWMRNSSSLLYLEAWEKIHNKDFKLSRMDQFKLQVFEGRDLISPKKYIEETGAIGIISKSGRYGGTFAHVDIAFEFASWMDPVFKLHIYQEFKRLKSIEYQQHKLEWNETRFLSKINAGILSASVKENQENKFKNKSIPYASAFDMINLAVFNMTAKEWRKKNPEAKGNIRDNASQVDLTLILNLESLNAVLIDAGARYEARLIRLYEVAKKQRMILEEDKRLNDEKKFIG